jgi:hypothetical protein
METFFALGKFPMFRKTLKVKRQIVIVNRIDFFRCKVEGSMTNSHTNIVMTLKKLLSNEIRYVAPEDAGVYDASIILLQIGRVTPLSTISPHQTFVLHRKRDGNEKQDDIEDITVQVIN